MKSQEKGSGQAQSSGSSDAAKKNHLFNVYSGWVSRVLQKESIKIVL